MEASVEKPVEAKPKSKRTALIVAAVLTVVAIVMIGILASMLSQNQNDGGDDGNGDDDDGPPPANLQIVTHSADYVGVLRDKCEFTVKVTNVGGMIGSKTLWCELDLGEDTYRASQYITLAPGETETYILTADVPMFSSGGTTHYYLS